MRIIDCITALLICEPSQPFFVFPPYVHIATLDLLLCIQQSIIVISATTNNASSSTISLSFWRSVFPGVFTALYKRIVGISTKNSHHNNEQRYITSIETKSLQSLTILLKSTLSSSSDKDNDDDGGTSSGGAIFITQLISMANNSNKKTTNNDDNRNNKTDNKLEIEQGDKIIDEYEIFISQVQKRVVGPLIVVLKQRAISQSISTREEIISLCHVILLDTPQCWKQRHGGGEKNDGTTAATSSGGSTTETRASGTIEEVAFEICIALQRDSDGM